ncbi:hypothetical protein BD770DRAFT_379767 [Pilaira anomala]|nr:hypothetical protein BD770DRAFT_379767 [Pilaira anomala]
MKCVDSGKSTQWATCNFGQWIIRDCGSGLVCYDGVEAGGGLYCNFPPNMGLKASTAEERFSNNADSLNNVVVVNDAFEVKDNVVVKSVPYGRMGLPGYRIVPLALEAQVI